jgi:hypothetical protein
MSLIEDLLPIPMFSISLDGFTTLKRDKNFYLWLALTLAIEWREWKMGNGGGGMRKMKR